MLDPRWRAVAIDLDGTIVAGTTTCLHLADWLGHRPVVEELERRFADGEISNTEVADGDAVHYRSRHRHEVRAAMESINCLRDVRPSVELLRKRGCRVLLTTVTWRFAAEAVADEFGFDDVCGTEMHEDESGALLGTVSRYFEPEDKRDFVIEYCRARSIPLGSVVAIGDARSDIPLFEVCGFSVALNATPAAQEAADAIVQSGSLLDALQAVPGLTGTAAPSRME